LVLRVVFITCAAHVHPEAVDGRDDRAPLVGVEAEYVVIEI
jgi:hypothetical protein